MSDINRQIQQLEQDIERQKTQTSALQEDLQRLMKEIVKALQ